MGEEGCLEQIEGVGGDGLEPVREISHILEWSDDSSQGGGEDRVQEGEGEGLTFRVLPPVRTHGVFGGGEVAGADGDQEVVTGCRSRSQGGAVSSRSDIDMDFFQGAQCRSEDGDPGELLAGSEPWEEEEVLAGPSAASWTGCRRDGKAVRATEVITQSTSGKGFAPPGGWVSKGKRPGYALQREGAKRPCGDRASRRRRLRSSLRKRVLEAIRLTREQIGLGGQKWRGRPSGWDPLPFLVAETENGHMTDVNGWEEKKTRQMMIDKGGQ
ncbi:hypothetical protein NDU88_003984 [Pleurodeles waltl]|uniref:Uncharacterized protein n=1 Tax=Pleurodeles waltl TaxID=8319 RepID=A0AAV7M5N0_PLEWA|nr:hypothetical protein NDU88_003984 [Pleurodeles waltl]